MNIFPTKQNGIALPVALILLFVMTLIGVASLRTSTLEEDMTANARLKLIAFNAAEATITDAEAYLKDITSTLSGEDIRVAFLGAANNQQGVPLVDINTGNIVDASTGGAQEGFDCQNSFPGATDLGGLCTPPEKIFDGSIALLTVDERWNDELIDVWNDPARHREYSNYVNSQLADEGVFQSPQYIIEYL